LALMFHVEQSGRKLDGPELAGYPR
jgi:hypothetical protein